MNKLQAEAVVYIDTKEKCRQVIDSHDTICQQCGGKLSPIETVDNSNHPTYWSGCESCQMFTHGVNPIAYQMAVDMVDNRYYIHYSHMDRPDGKEQSYKDYYRLSQIGGTANHVASIIWAYEQIKNKQ